MKVKPGNAQNSKLNGEWAKHVRGKAKKHTSKIRRARNKMIIVKDLDASVS